MTFGRRVSDMQAVSAKETYAASSTSGPSRWTARRSRAARGTVVPDGEFGLARKVKLARGSGQGSGSCQSAVNGTASKRAPCNSANVRYRLQLGVGEAIRPPSETKARVKMVRM